MKTLKDSLNESLNQAVENIKTIIPKSDFVMSKRFYPIPYSYTETKYEDAERKECNKFEGSARADMKIYMEKDGFNIINSKRNYDYKFSVKPSSIKVDNNKIGGVLDDEYQMDLIYRIKSDSMCVCSSPEIPAASDNIFNERGFIEINLQFKDKKSAEVLLDVIKTVNPKSKLTINNLTL